MSLLYIVRALVVITRQWQSFITKFIMLKEINQVIQNDRTLLKKKCATGCYRPKDHGLWTFPTGPFCLGPHLNWQYIKHFLPN